MLRGDSPWWKMSFGLVILGTGRSTITIRPRALLSRRSVAPMELHSSSTACGIFFLSATEFISLPESPTKNTGYSASSPKIKATAKIERRRLPIADDDDDLVCKKRGRPLLGCGS